MIVALWCGDSRSTCVGALGVIICNKCGWRERDGCWDFICRIRMGSLSHKWDFYRIFVNPS